MDNLKENEKLDLNTSEEEINTDEVLEDADEENKTEEPLKKNEDFDEESFFGGGDNTYVKKADKYDDVKSSAFTMLIVGLLGLIFITLTVTKVINLPISETTSWLFYSIMGLVFLAFVVAGFFSFRRSIKLKDEAEIENKKIDEINEWVKENLTVDVVDSDIDTSETVEILYFARAEKIKNLLMHQFEDVDEGLIDLLTENIYQKLYEDDDLEDEYEYEYEDEYDTEKQDGENEKE